MPDRRPRSGSELPAATASAPSIASDVSQSRLSTNLKADLACRSTCGFFLSSTRATPLDMRAQLGERDRSVDQPHLRGLAPSNGSPVMM